MLPTQVYPQRPTGPIGGMSQPINRRPTYTPTNKMPTGGFAPTNGGFVPPPINGRTIGDLTKDSAGAGLSGGNRRYAGGMSQNGSSVGGALSPTGDRRYYDQQRNNLAQTYSDQSGALQKQFDNRTKKIMSMLNGYGNQQLADARQAGQNLQSNVLGGMANRGLSGTTLMQAGQTMADTATQNNVNRINEQLQNQKTNLMTGLTSDALGFGERAMNNGMQLGQQNIRDSRGDYENDRNFGEQQFQNDRQFGYDQYRDARNFNRGIYEDDRNFQNSNYEIGRAHV